MMAGVLVPFLAALPAPIAAASPPQGAVHLAQGRINWETDVGIDQHLDQKLPMDLEFTDSEGHRVRLGDLFGQRPVVLNLVYYECPMLCTLVLNGLVKAMRAMVLELGRDYDVISVSIDPDEGPELAKTKKQAYLKRYGRKGSEHGWHMLTGDEQSIRALADAVGFRYRYDPKSDEFAHAAGIMVVTPEGRLARYFFDVEYAPRDLRLALVEASQGRIGNLVDAVTLLCYHYDPTTGKYGFAIMSAIRILGVATLLALGSFVLLHLWRERRSRPKAA